MLLKRILTPEYRVLPSIIWTKEAFKLVRTLLKLLKYGITKCRFWASDSENWPTSPTPRPLLQKKKKNCKGLTFLLSMHSMNFPILRTSIWQRHSNSSNNSSPNIATSPIFRICLACTQTLVPNFLRMSAWLSTGSNFLSIIPLNFTACQGKI